MVHQGVLILSLFSSVADSLQGTSQLAFDVQTKSLLNYDPHTPHTWAKKDDVAEFARTRTGTATDQVALDQESQSRVVRTAKVEQQAALPSSKQPTVEIDKILPVIFVLYGSLAVLWFVHQRFMQHENRTSKIILLCASWCSMSVGMHTLNKALTLLLGTPSLIALSQMIVSVVIFGAMSWKDVAEADRKQILTWMIVPLFFASMLISSFYTYQFISLSMLTIVRNLTPLVVLPIETFVMPKEKQPTINRNIIGSIMIMLCGAIIYGGNVIDFSWVGVSFALLNMVLACSDRLIQRRLLTDHCKGLSSSACSILNNGVAMIPTFAMALATNEVSKATTTEGAAHWTDPAALCILLLSGLIGMGICYFGFECQREVSATSFFVMQNLSKVAVVSVGVTVFGDPLSSPWAVLGLAMSLGGSAIYGQAQMAEQSKDKAGETQALLPTKDSQKDANA